jgi:hypothetical protein
MEASRLGTALVLFGGADSATPIVAIKKAWAGVLKAAKITSIPFRPTAWLVCIPDRASGRTSAIVLLASLVAISVPVRRASVDRVAESLR